MIFRPVPINELQVDIRSLLISKAREPEKVAGAVSASV
jgi:hypothetical protein